jgi:fucose permease
MAFTAKAFPDDQGKAVGLVSAMSSVGGLSLPRLDGFVVDQSSAQGSTLFNLGLLMALALFLVLSVRLTRRHPHEIR